ncbi:MAG: hypothetical protein R2781_08610 [Flavobacteriaceae bacterium]
MRDSHGIDLTGASQPRCRGTRSFVDVRRYGRDVDGDGNDDDVDATDGISYFDLTAAQDAILDGQVG